MGMIKKPTAKSKLTGADITGQKYNTKIKEEAAKVRLKVRMKEKLTPYEKSLLGADTAIKKMNTKPTAKPAATKKPMTPAQRQALAKRPAVGSDKAAAKMTKGRSHNNGYTN